MHGNRKKGAWKAERNGTLDSAPVSCFNTRIDFLNNLSDGLTKKSKHKKGSVGELEYAPSPGSYYHRKQSSNKSSIGGGSSIERHTINTMTTSMSTNTTMDSNSSIRSSSTSNDDSHLRVSKWYVSLGDTNNDSVINTSPSNTQDRVMIHHEYDLNAVPENMLLKRVGGRLKYGTSLKLQNGSKPVSFRKKGNDNNKDTKDPNKYLQNVEEDDDDLSIKNYNNNTLSVASERSDTLSDNFDPLSDKYDDPFSRTSSAMSNNSYSPKLSVASLTLDSNYSTSEYASIRHSTLASNDRAAFEDDENDELRLERERLKTVLDNIDPRILKEQMKKCLTSGKPSLTNSLRTLLPKNKFTGQTSHCLRCHKDYDRRYGDKTCVLRHPRHDVIMISEDDKSAVFQCDRCTCVFKLEGVFEYDSRNVDIAHCGACYVGTHSDRPSDVEYDPNGFAKHCSEKGCDAIFFV